VKINPIFWLGGVGLAFASCEQKTQLSDSNPGNAEVLVKFENTLTEDDRIRFEKAQGLIRRRGFADGQTFLYQGPSPDAREVIANLKKQPGIVFVESNQTYHTARPGPGQVR